MAQSQAALEEAPQSFGEWFREMCETGGIGLRQIHTLFIRAGGETSESTMERWMKAINDPPATAVPYLVKALRMAPSLKGIDVRASYAAWMQSFKQTPRASRGRLSAVPGNARPDAPAGGRRKPGIGQHPLAVSLR